MLLGLLLELDRARLRQFLHAIAGFDAGDGALAEVVIQAIGVAILDPQPLRRAQLLALLALGVFERLLIGNGHALVPLRRLRLQALHDFVGAAVAMLLGLALLVRKCKRGRPDEDGRRDGCNTHCAGQFFVLSTNARCLIHGIISRSLAPTCSAGCSASFARVALNEVWLTLFSSIQSRVKRPDWISARMRFISARGSCVITRGPEAYSPYFAGF